MVSNVDAAAAKKKLSKTRPLILLHIADEYFSSIYNSSSLRLVEGLLNEFYQPATSNSRKREIETQLISFKNLPNSWQICLRVATTFETNQFLWFFCSSTVEFAITRRWVQLTLSDRSALRETLWTTYANLSTASNSQNVPRRQRETLAQLIAIMGKREFSDENPKYMHDCMELIKTNFQLGISLLRITSEEVLNNRDGVTTDRKKYFYSCISMVIPDVMALVTKYLLIAVCHINGKDVHSIENILVDYTLLPSLPNNSDLEASVVELLNCAQHLVSWVPNELISEYFILSILDLSQWRSEHSEVSLAALYVLNELLYLQKTVLYVATLMNGVNGLLHQHNSIKCQNEMYDDKLRELLRLYTTKYWTKLLQHNEIFEVFLKSFFCFTIAKKGALDFTEKLDAWRPIIKALIATSKLERYCDLIHQLVAEVMRRTRFEFNKAELEILDNEVDDNMQTEWQQYLTQCFECVALVAETRPNAVFEQVYSHWSRPYVFFKSFESYINDGKTLEITNKVKCHTFNEQLRDLSSVCQALVRIAPLLGVDSAGTTDVYCHMSLLTDNLLTLLNLFSSQKLYFLYNEKTELKTDLIEMYAHVLMAIRSLLPISAYLKSEQNLKHLTEIVGNIFLPCSYTNSPLVYLAASELFLCITSVIRPKFLFDIQTIVNLLQIGPRLPHLQKQVISNIYMSLISYLILPWRQVTDQQQDFQQRCTILKKYLDSIAQDFLELEASYCLISQEAKVSSVTLELLPTLKVIVDYFKDSNNTAKEMLVTTLKPIIMKSLMIYDGCGVANIEMSTTIADFCLSIFRTLQNQLGAAFVKDVILLFITVREPLNSGRLVIMEKVLQMFQLVVEQPGNSSLSMLPSILDFTTGQILPTVLQNVTDKSDISYAVYTLFDSILNCKWQYFYKSHIQQNGIMYQNENLHPDHFISILTAYGEVLVTDNDPNVVRIVLESLQKVNEKWHLYERALFKENLLSSFLNALLKILLSGEAALNYELLVTTLFAMGQVDKSTLGNVFSSVGYPTNVNIEELCLSTDIPTFSQKLTQMIQDTHCTRILETV